jgi:hypothetical protein
MSNAILPVLLLAALVLFGLGGIGLVRWRYEARHRRLDADYRAAALVINTRREVAARAHRHAEDVQ